MGGSALQTPHLCDCGVACKSVHRDLRWFIVCVTLSQTSRLVRQYMQISVYFSPYCFSLFGSFSLVCHCLFWLGLERLHCFSLRSINSFEFIQPQHHISYYRPVMKDPEVFIFPCVVFWVYGVCTIPYRVYLRVSLSRNSDLRCL